MTKSFLLLYASQSGQAKAIAEEIRDKAPSFGLKARLFCLSLTDKKFSIEKESCVIFVVSTTGDGEPPDTALKFFCRYSKVSANPNLLQHLNYSLLALGDSNYIKFCLFGRVLDKVLKDLSAKAFYPTGYGDDADGIETGVDKWMSNLWPALRKQLGLPPMNINARDIHSEINDSNNFYTPCFLPDIPSIISNIDIAKCKVPTLPLQNFYVEYESINLNSEIQFNPHGITFPSQASSLSTVNIIAARKLTYGNDAKNTIELTLQFQDNNYIPYLPGDSFGFICPNPSHEVDLLLKRLCVQDFADCILNFTIHKSAINKKKKLPSHIPLNVSLRYIFSHCLELRSVPKKILLRILADYTSDQVQKKCLLFLCSTEGSKYYTHSIRKPNVSILDILLFFPTCSPPVEILLEYLPNLKPRFYSVSSSPLQDPKIFRIIFNIINLKKEEGRMVEREGVCTGWLNKISSVFQSREDVGGLSEQFSNLELSANKNSVYIYKRTNNHFRFPANFDCPIIMVGPGTGIAPFIGYLRHRELLKSEVKESEVWLFYGCRWLDRDYLYKSELQKLKENGTLTHLYVSHSRETAQESRYVQENIRKHGPRLVEAINNGAKIMVCGDAQHMVHDVQQAFIDVVMQSLHPTQEEAKSFIDKLQTDHRYVHDVWI